MIPILCEAVPNKGLKPLVPQGSILLKLKSNRYKYLLKVGFKEISRKQNTCKGVSQNALTENRLVDAFSEVS
jgi:hypothetical protein